MMITVLFPFRGYAGHVYLFREKVQTDDRFLRLKLIESIRLLKSKGIRPEILRARAVKLFPIYDAIFNQYGVPLDFKYLSVIESALDPLALSPLGAKGLWQFMPETARDMGMRVSSTIDERVQMERSTQNACIYLRRNKALLGSWLLAAASFNCGGGCIQKAIKRAGHRDYFRLQLNRETSDYLYRILAAKMLFEDYFEQDQILEASNDLQALIKTPIESIDPDSGRLILESPPVAWKDTVIPFHRIQLVEIGSIRLQNSFDRPITSTMKTLRLRVLANSFFAATEIEMDVDIDYKSMRLYLSKRLIDLASTHHDTILQVMDEDLEWGIALPNISEDGRIVLESNFKLQAKILRYE